MREYGGGQTRVEAEQGAVRYLAASCLCLHNAPLRYSPRGCGCSVGGRMAWRSAFAAMKKQYQVVRFP